jgi:hypothetical protein
VGLVRLLLANTDHFSDCACVTCEDARAFLASAPPVPPTHTQPVVRESLVRVR